MAQFVNARHNDLIAGAAPVSFLGTVVANTARPQPQPAYGPQHVSGEAPFVSYNGTPPFVPPNARNNGWFAFAALHEGSPAPFTFVGKTPPFIPPPPRNLGYSAFGFAWDPGDYQPYAFTRSSVQQILLIPPPRGGSVFIGSDQRIGTEAAFSFLRPAVAVTPAQIISNPPLTASFQKAGGWWDILSEAPFFFAAGFSTQPPRGPFGSANGVAQTSDYAPFSFTNGSPAVPLTLYVPSQAFGQQQPADVAAFSFTRNSIALNQAGSPVTDDAFGLQLPADTAPFTFVFGRQVFTVSKPAPGAFGYAQVPDPAPYVFTRDGSPKIIVFTPSFKALGYAQAPDPAPFVFTNKFLPGASIIVPLPASMGTRTFPQPWATDPAPFFFTFPTQYSGGIPAGSLLVQQAVFNLVNAGLEVFITYGYSMTVPYGYVISQNPPAGTPLPPFSVVTIVASEGFPPAPGVLSTITPSLNGLTAQDARNALFAAGLSLGQSIWVISAQTAGTVVSQNIPALMPVPYGTIVQLTLSLGPTKTVPPIVSPP